MSTRLTDKYGITQENLSFRRQFVRLGPEERALMLELAPFVERCAGGVVRDFYDFQFSFGPAVAFFQQAARNSGRSLEELREHLEVQQQRYLIEIFHGAQNDWGLDYFERRLGTGRTHDRINLPLKWYVGGYVEYLRLLRVRLEAAYPAERVALMIEVIHRVFNYDIQAIGDSFLLHTLESMGLGVDAVKVERLQDKTEKIDLLKKQVRTLVAQAAAVADDRIDHEIMTEKVPGLLGESFSRVLANMRLMADQAAALSRGDLGADVLQQLARGDDKRVLGGAMRSIHRLLPIA